MGQPCPTPTGIQSQGQKEAQLWASGPASNVCGVPTPRQA